MPARPPAAIAFASSRRRWTRRCISASCSKRSSATRSCIDGFVLHYQPVFEMADKKLIGFEALAAAAGARRHAHPAGDLHSDRRGDAADRQDRRLGAARGLPHRDDVAGAPDGGGEPVAGAVRERRPSKRRVADALQELGSRAATGSNWKSPRRCCSATPTPPWPRSDGSRTWACRSSWTTSAPAIRA